jgi:lipoate-protein ligase A
MLHLLESPPRAEDNLALDNAWFQSLEAGAGADALHLWESPVPVLHHGTLLHAFDASLVGKYLLEPCRQPGYRSGRQHADFLGNLPLSAAETGARLQKLLLFSTKGPEIL